MTTHNRTGWGYYHMINFFAFGIFEHAALADAKYIMRIDCDGTLERPMPDLFDAAMRHDATYVTPCANIDCGDIIEGASAVAPLPLPPLLLTSLLLASLLLLSRFIDRPSPLASRRPAGPRLRRSRTIWPGEAHAASNAAPQKGRPRGWQKWQAMGEGGAS